MQQKQLEIKLHEELEGLVDPSNLPHIVDAILKVMPRERADLVTDFHKAFSHPINNTPTIDTLRHKYRVKYLHEEVDEITDALLNEDHTTLVDTYIDILYFAYGGLVEAGVADKVQALFEEVHRSNMSKLCSTDAIARATMNKYKEDGVDTYYKPVEDENIDLYVVKRVGDDKILKSIEFSEPRLNAIINDVFNVQE